MPDPIPADGDPGGPNDSGDSEDSGVLHGTHVYADDPRNDEILVHVNGELRPRAEAVVSVFDAGFVLGDGVWEGLRVRRGHPVFLDRHLDRLFEGAKALALDHWYAAVHRSTGFAPPTPRDVHLTGPPAAVAAQVRPLYDHLHTHRWLP